MGAVRIIRRLAQLLDVHFTDIQDGDGVVWDEATGKFINAPGGGSGSPTGPAGGVLSGTYPNPGFAADMATQAELDAETALRISGDIAAVATAEGYTDTHVATEAAARAAAVTAAIATAEGYTDSAVAGLSTVYQPLDSDLTAIAALSTTSFGRAVLALADAAALRTAAGLGTAAIHAATDFDASGAAAAAQAASQPLDSDLTAIAALTTTSYGRAFLALADAAAARAALSLGTAALSATGDFDAAGAAAAAQSASQPLDSDLTAIAALTTTSYGRAFLALADAAAGRTALGLGTLATQSGTFSGTSSGTNTGDQTLSDATISTSDVTTNNVTSTKHGFAPKSPADATTFLNGAATPAYAQPKDSDLATTDVTTNNVSTSKHGFAPKAPNDATKFLDGTGAYSTPASGGGTSLGLSYMVSIRNLAF